MNLSKEDLFLDAAETAAATAKTSDVLDFHSHGDDVMGQLWWFVHTDTAGSVTVKWQTSSDNSTFTDLVTKTATATANSYPVLNEPLPKGMKRYNRLSVTTASASKVTAGLTAGRDEGTPVTGPFEG